MSLRLVLNSESSYLSLISLSAGITGTDHLGLEGVVRRAGRLRDGGVFRNRKRLERRWGGGRRSELAGRNLQSQVTDDGRFWTSDAFSRQGFGLFGSIPPAQRKAFDAVGAQ